MLARPRSTNPGRGRRTLGAPTTATAAVLVVVCVSHPVIFPAWWPVTPQPAPAIPLAMLRWPGSVGVPRSLRSGFQ